METTADARNTSGITREVKELFQAIRTAGLSGREPTELVILGICRRNKNGLIKKGKHIFRIIGKNPNLFCWKPGVTPRGRRCTLILPTSEGNSLMDALEGNSEMVHPVSLIRRQSRPGAPTLYVLEGYYTDPSGRKRTLTLLFQSKLLFLNNGDVGAIPSEATEAVGEIKCLWKQCKDEVLDFQNPQPLETLPHIKHLIRYVVSRFRTDSISMLSGSELEYACLLEMKRLFPGTREIEIKLGCEQVSMLRVPVTKREQVYICMNCKAASCHHVGRLFRH